MQDPAYAVFQRPGAREVRRQPVTELLRYQSNAPFGIVGLDGNVAEWPDFYFGLVGEVEGREIEQRPSVRRQWGPGE